MLVHNPVTSVHTQYVGIGKCMVKISIWDLFTVSLIQAGATWSESERETTRARFRIEVEPELDGGQIIRLRSTTIEVIDRFRDNINPFPELCDVHVSQCPLVRICIINFRYTVEPLNKNTLGQFILFINYREVCFIIGGYEC